LLLRCYKLEISEGCENTIVVVKQLRYVIDVTCCCKHAVLCALTHKEQREVRRRTWRTSASYEV